MSKRLAERALRRQKKKVRIRKKVKGTAERPRLAIFRSSKNIYAQLIDDVQQKTLGGVSSLTPALRKEIDSAKTKTEEAKIVGKAAAETAKNLKLKSVVFDRGGYLYHGRVKALAEGAREGGLEF